jgi:chromosome segregation ATPase
MDTLRTVLSTYDAVVAERDSLSLKYATLKGKYKASGKRKLNYKLDFALQELATSEENYRKSSEEICELQCRLEEAERDRDAFRQDTIVLTDDATTASEEITELEQRIETVENERDHLLQTISTMEMNKGILDDEIVFLTDQKNEAITERDEAVAEQDKLFDEMMALKLDLSELKLEKDALESASDVWDVEREELLQEIKRLKKENKKLRKAE